MQSAQMESPWNAFLDEVPVTPRTQALSISAQERALRRVSNPAYSGSPASSQNSLKGRSHTSAISSTGEFMSTGRIPEPADQRASTSVVTAPPSTRDDWSNIPKLKADVSFPDASQAAFGLKHAGIDTISSFPLQGGDSLAASLSGSVQGSAHHSLCIDDLGELPPENATGQRGVGDCTGPCISLETTPAIHDSASAAEQDVLEHIPEAGTDFVESILNQKSSSVISGSEHVESSSASKSVNAESIFELSASIPAEAATDLPEALSETEEVLTKEAILRHTSQVNGDSPGDVPITTLVTSQEHVMTRPRLTDSAKDHHMNDVQCSEDDVCSESSVSVGSYVGQPPGPQEDGLGATGFSPFTFTTMPDAGHGSPQNHCFKQTPASLLTGCTSASPHVVRALFMQESPDPRPRQSNNHSFMKAGSQRPGRGFKRLWQAICLISLLASLAVAVVLLGRGRVTTQQEASPLSMFKSAQQHMQQLCTGDLSNTVICSIHSRLNRYLDPEVPLSVLKMARQRFRKIRVSDALDAIWHVTFRSAVVLNYRIGWAKDLLVQAKIANLSWIHSRTADIPIDHTADEGDSSLEAIPDVIDVAQVDVLKADPDVTTVSQDRSVHHFNCGPPHHVEECYTPVLEEHSFDHFNVAPSREKEARPDALLDGTEEVRESTNPQVDGVDVSAPAFGHVSKSPKGDEIPFIEGPLPSVDQAYKISPPDSLIQRIQAKCQATRCYVSKMKNSVFVRFVRLYDLITMHAVKLRTAIRRYQQELPIHAKSIIVNKDWHHLHGIDHSLVFCAALALLMSAISLLWVAAAPLFRDRRHVDTGSPLGVQSGTVRFSHTSMFRRSCVAHA